MHVQAIRGIRWDIPPSAADLKFLRRLPQARVGNFKAKSGTGTMAGAPLLPKFVSEGLRCMTNFGSGAPVPGARRYGPVTISPDTRCG